jgi:hypothetical protein
MLSFLIYFWWYGKSYVIVLYQDCSRWSSTYFFAISIVRHINFLFMSSSVTYGFFALWNLCICLFQKVQHKWELVEQWWNHALSRCQNSHIMYFKCIFFTFKYKYYTCTYICMIKLFICMANMFINYIYDLYIYIYIYIYIYNYSFQTKTESIWALDSFK